MKGWSKHKGLALGIPTEGIDTDQLIQMRFMTTPRSEGYGKFLLHDARFDCDGEPVVGHPLNRPDAEQATVMIARRNFGSGSSREAAVYALKDFGFKVIIAPSFGDIFSANAVNNGVLPCRLPEELVEELLTLTEKSLLEISIDLNRKSINFGNCEVHFEMENTAIEKLINGWDDITLTMEYDSKITAHKTNYIAQRPWAALTSRVAKI